MLNKDSGSDSRHLLFVDDDPRILAGIRRSLKHAEPLWTFSSACSVDAALAFLQQNEVDVIITDVSMPVRDGFDLLQTVVQSPALSSIPVVVLTGGADSTLKRRALDLGAFDLIGKPICLEDLIARLRSVLRTRDYQNSLARLNDTLEKKVADRTAELEGTRTDIVICLAMAGECRDTETGHHLIRVAQYARRLAEAASLKPEDVDLIFKASPLHDIGKLGVPDQILLKCGPLTADERKLMQTHCDIGHRILTTPAAVAANLNATVRMSMNNPLLCCAAQIALCHHERWDGKGYPQGHQGTDIPVSGRIVAIADVYDALTSVRPYKVAMPHEQAMDLIIKGSGSQFDPGLIECLKPITGAFDDIRRECADPSQVRSSSIISLGNVFTPRLLSA